MAESMKEQIKERTERIWGNTDVMRFGTRALPDKNLEAIRIALNDIRYLNGIEEMLE